MGDSVYHGVGEEMAWSPDLLIEVFEEQNTGEEELVYAIIMDAKYTKKIVERHHWQNVLKISRNKRKSHC